MTHENQAGAEDAPHAENSEQPETPSPHDGLFHRVFRRQRYAAELVRLAVERTSGWAVDEERLRVASRSYNDRKLRGTQSDLLVYAPLTPAGASPPASASLSSRSSTEEDGSRRSGTVL